MTSIIKVIKGTTEVSLFDASGFNLQMRGWDMAPADREAGVVRERIRCKMTTTSSDDAAAQFQTLNGLLEDAVLYSKNDPVQDEPVYIETQFEGETNKRYAMIAGDYARFKVPPFDPTAKLHGIFRSVDLVVTREHPWSSHKPGLLPGRIQLESTDGPAFDYGSADYDVDLVSTFGHKPNTVSGGVIGRPGQFGGAVQVGEVMENLVTNPSFEVDIDGWTIGGTNTAICTFLDDEFTRANNPPGEAPTGHVWQLIAAGGGVVEAAIVGNELVAADSGGPTTAAYTGVDLGAGILPRGMSATIVFNADLLGGSAVLVSNPNGLATVANITGRSVHINFADYYCAIAYFEAGDLISVGSYTYLVACLRDNATEYSIGWEISGDDIVVYMPDGTIQTYTSAMLVSKLGRYCTYEHYWATGKTQARFLDVALEEKEPVSKYGSASLRATYVDNTWLVQHPITLTAAAHTGGMWVYIPSDYDGTDLTILLSGFDGSAYEFGHANMAIVDDWQFVACYVTPVGGDLAGVLTIMDLGDAPSVGKYIYMDGIDAHLSTYPLPHCDGSLGPGHSWSGAAHGSTSDRVASVLPYDIDDISSKGTIGFWMKTIYEEDEVTAAKYVISLSDGTTTNRLVLYVDPGSNVYYTFYTGNGAHTGVALGAGNIVRLTNEFVVIMWDLTADEFKLFVDGVQIGSTGTGLTAPTVGWDRLYIGADWAGASQWSGWMDDLFLLDRTMSDAEVLNLYNSGAKFPGDPDLVMYLPFDGPQQLHIANFRDDVEIDEIYNYDETGASWSSNLAAETEFQILPDDVTDGDFILLASTDQPPKHIVLNLRTAGVLPTSTLLLQYWNTDPAWTTLVLNEDYAVYPGTTLEEALASTGNVVISIIPPSDFLKVDPGTGTEAYCIRIYESDVGPSWTTNPIHAGQLVYAARTNELRIPAASLHGDAPPKVLLRLHADGGGDADPGFARLSRIVWGIKSKGLAGFTSNLNAGNQDNPDGWTVTYNIADTTSSADPMGPGGYSAGITFATSELLVARFTMTGVDKAQYWLGNYRVYLLCRQTSGDAGDISVRLRTYLGGVEDYDPHVDTATYPLEGVEEGYEAVDMGELNIPFGLYHSADDFSNQDLIFVVFAKRDAGAGTLRIHSLILIPIGQASGTLNDTTGTVPGSAFALIGGEAIDHDGGILGRGTRKVAISGIDQQTLMGWDSGGAFVEINQLDVESRIYFLLLHYPLGGTWGTGPMIASPGCHLMGELHLHHSYRLLRGND